MNKAKSPVAALDKFVFIKNGYSFLKHLAPFLVTALLPLIMTLPDENVLLKLVNVIEQPSWVWIPACLLTFVAGAVYVRSVNVQVRRAYLWSDMDLRRTIITSLTYIILCTLIAYGVLQFASSQQTSSGAILACLLLAVFSLAGICRSVPDGWVKSIGIKSPDYTEGRQSAKTLMDIFGNVRKKPYGEKRDIQDFLKAAQNLCSEIEKNLELEPEWAKHELETVKDQIRTLIEQTQKHFLKDNKSAVENFPAACSCEQEPHYPEFVRTIRTLGNYWNKLQCPQRRS